MCAYIYVYILIHTPTAERDFKSLKFLLFYAAVWIEQEIMLSPPLPWITAFKIPERSFLQGTYRAPYISQLQGQPLICPQEKGNALTMSRVFSKGEL